MIQKAEVSRLVVGTQVLTREGFKNIEDIQPGDYVYSTSDETGESGYKEVLEVFVKETEVITHVFYEIQEEDGEIRTEEIETTLNHRFWSEGEWKSAGTLKAGDLLTLADGTQVEVTEVTYEDRHETVYNMEVADYHTYYVGEDGVWVHNRYGQQRGSGDPAEELIDLMKEGDPTSDGRNIITELDDNNKVIFRMDVGENAHSMGKYGYDNPVNHINIEIQARNCNGKYKTKWDFHIILNDVGEVIDTFTTGVWNEK